ncbi:MAG: hypothetical protein EOO39_40975, partial [Cytophagaceae bacterium]
VPPPINCSGAFSGCSATCGGGTQTYIISQAAQNGGAACAFNSGQTQACNTQACTPPATPTPIPASTCSDRVIYHPCKSTACNTTDYDCPSGQVINKYRAGNMWTGPNYSGILVSWTGSIASLCVAPAACVDPNATCTAPVQNVTLAMPGRVRSASGSVSVTTGFGAVDHTGSTCSGTSTVTANGVTATITATGTFPPGINSCNATASANVGGAIYTVDVDVDGSNIPGSPHDLHGSASVSGSCSGPPSTPTPAPPTACYTVRYPSTWGGAPGQWQCFTANQPDAVINRGEEVTHEANVCRSTSSGLMVGQGAGTGCVGSQTVSCDANGVVTTSESCDVF